MHNLPRFKSPLSRVVVTAGAVLFALSGIETSALAADWPQWRGVFRTGEASGTDAELSGLPAQPKVVWRVPVGDGFSSPVVSGGHVVLLDNVNGRETVHQFDAVSGRAIWHADLDESHRDGFGIGPRCTPLIDEERVYVQSAKGELRCLSMKDGKTIWRTNFVADFGAIYIGEKGKAAGASRHGASGAPLIDGDRLIAQVGSEQGASVVAFEKRTGKVVWKSQSDQSAYAGLFSSSVAGQPQILSFTAEGLIGLKPDDGSLLWRVPFKTALGRHVTTPVVAADLVIVASHQIGLNATRIAKDDKNFSASEAWSNKSLGFNFSTPVLVSGHLYGLAPGKKIVCVEAKSGQVAWEQEGLIQTSADKAEAAFLVFRDRILMLNDTGELILFAADHRSYREMGRAQVCGKNWCSPAFSNGKLYLRDGQDLLCVDLRAEQ